MQKEELNKVFGSDLLPLEIKWSCIGAGKEKCYTQNECVVKIPGCCFLLNFFGVVGGSTVDEWREDE